MKRKTSTCSKSSFSSDSESSSSSSTSLSSDSDSGNEKNINEKNLKKKLKKIKKKVKKKEKKLLKKKIKKLKKAKKELKRKEKTQKMIQLNNNDSKTVNSLDNVKDSSQPVIINPDDLQKSKARAPLTKEEWERQQSIIRRVYDPETGRNRLIKGDGEVLEECVSRERHLAINKSATRSDGEFFQSAIMSKVKKT